MRMNNAPEPRFIDGLEKRLTSELRRQRRFGPPYRSAGLKRFVRTATLIVTCAVAGVAAAKTVEHLESTRRKALNMARATTAVELAFARQEMVRGMLRQAEQRVEAGLIKASELEDNGLQSKLVDLDLKKAKLDLQEISETGESPADELYAPVLGGRDFVIERLWLEYQRAAAIEERLKVRLAHTEKLAEDGLVSHAETSDVRTQLEHAGKEVAGVRRRMNLRAEFVSGDMTARQVSVRAMLNEARARFETADNIYSKVSAEFKEAKSAYEEGLVPESEFRQAEYQMVSARAEYRLARLELELLEEELKK